MSRRRNDDEDDTPAVKTDRRTWDKEAYARKALERLEAIAAGEDPDKIDPEDKGIFRAAPAELPRVPGSERAFLQTREKGMNFDAQVGARRVLADAVDPLKTGGYYCPVCECTLKDSAAYLDHINGKRHQRRLGFSMRVQHSTVDQVKNRLEMHKLKRQREAEAAITVDPTAHLREYEAKMRKKAEEEAERKRLKKERRKLRKLGLPTDGSASVVPGEDEEDTSDDDEGKGGQVDDKQVPGGTCEEDAMMAAMGFAGFGSTKKN